MSRNEKRKFIRLVEGSQMSTNVALKKYDIPPSTYYRWKRKMKSMGAKGLQDNKPYRDRMWNQLLPYQVDRILEYATFSPELSSREILNRRAELKQKTILERKEVNCRMV